MSEDSQPVQVDSGRIRKKKSASRKTRKIMFAEADDQEYYWPSSYNWPSGMTAYFLLAVAYVVVLAFYRLEKFRSWFLFSLLALLLQASLLFNESLPTPWLPVAVVFVMLLMCILTAFVLWNIKDDQDRLISELKERNATQCADEMKKLKVLNGYNENLIDFFLFILLPLLVGTVGVLGWRGWAPKPRWVRGGQVVAGQKKIENKIADVIRKAAQQQPHVGYVRPYYAGYW